ncbi:LON peptidase substrate-binding domain-containing protein [Flexibacterium corallicola]|uniref:LON peptidase substrate-binding domain-containing protein n=1 Tax=Flexibacterium corallicola TaxID=3037259 RepID=UPI00286ED2AB|nr:LON peptidase substrate-binding domain-containing protein [Pseudovibrio sp. M1P-2-3]
MKVGNATYSAINDVPRVVPVFPLPGGLLLPRAHLPLNIFEPRYMALVDAALRTDRTVGLVQPALNTKEDELEGRPKLCSVGCVGRITAFQETGDGRYLLTLSGISRFNLVGELEERSQFRRGAIDLTQFAQDFTPGLGEEDVDRDLLLKTLRAYLTSNDLEADWDGINDADNEVLVNALSLMSPFGAREKQALLEAESLKMRAETLIALTEVELAKNDSSSTGNILQ